MSIKRILFLCTGNSARSQIAEGLLRSKSGSLIDVQSAGIEPKVVNPYAIQVMDEIGIDISHQRSKDVSEVIKNPFDWVITVCDNAKELCPIFPSARLIHWNLRDPQTLNDFRQTRDDLSVRITELLRTIDPSNS
jgi:arsenate reductase (thioredoxin)